MDLVNPVFAFSSNHEKRKSFPKNYSRLGNLAVLTIFLLILSVSMLAADDFGIPKRKGSFKQTVTNFVSAPLSTVQIAPETAPVNPKVTSRFEPDSSSSSSSTFSASTSISSSAPPSASSSLVTSSLTPSPLNSYSITDSQFPNVVRLIAFDQKGQSFGSGSYIGNYGEYGLILSNWHVVCESDGLVHVHFANGFSSYGAVVQADKKWDLALIVISRPPQAIPLLPIAKTAPKPGDPLWIAGYGSGSYRLAGGYCIRYFAPEIPKDGSVPQYEIVDLSVSARQGDSGGPILNAKGELAGVLFGSDMIHNTAGSYCERVNQFLTQTRSLLEKLPSRPESHFASIERGGPRRLLTESLNANPISQEQISLEQSQKHALQQSRANFSNSSTSFGVRSNQYRYTQQVPSAASFPVFDKGSEKTTEKKPEMPPTFLRTIPTEQQYRDKIPAASETSPTPVIPVTSHLQPTPHRVVQTAVRKKSPIPSSFRTKTETETESDIEKKIQSVTEKTPETVLVPLQLKTAQRTTSTLFEQKVKANPDSDIEKGLQTVSQPTGTIPLLLNFFVFLVVATLIIIAVQLIKEDLQPFKKYVQ